MQSTISATCVIPATTELHSELGLTAPNHKTRSRIQIQLQRRAQLLVNQGRFKKFNFHVSALKRLYNTHSHRRFFALFRSSSPHPVFHVAKSKRCRTSPAKASAVPSLSKNSATCAIRGFNPILHRSSPATRQFPPLCASVPLCLRASIKYLCNLRNLWFLPRRLLPDPPPTG